jgi:hypothetical protein
MDERWLPRGHHWDLHIEHFPAGQGAGQFTGGGWKLVWHITVSPWQAVDAMVTTVCAKNAEPNFVIGGRKGSEQPIVVQLLPLDVAGRSLQHTLPEQTNRANCIQVEICAWDSDGAGRKPEDVIKHWADARYKALGNLAGLVSHRVEIPTKCPRAFSNTRRFTGAGFVKTSGHVGHMHVPGNDHEDPTTAFKGAALCKYIKSAPNEL